MNPNILFSISNGVAVLGWLMLIFAGRVKRVATLISAFIIPGLLSLVYAAVLATHWIGHKGGFSTLPQVELLFTDPWLVLMGWVHYLAFDLFLGAWQVRDAQRHGMSHLWTTPTMILTFLFGPVGFLLYLLIRGFAGRREPAAMVH